jgi:hypothetical protein
MPHQKRRGGGLSERDLTLCRRFLLEMFNIWPHSVALSQCFELHCLPCMDKVEVCTGTQYRNFNEHFTIVAAWQV